MRIEGHYHAGAVYACGSRANLGHEALVAKVDTVERADRKYDRGSRQFLSE
jgi:hypothetical protein